MFDFVIVKFVALISKCFQLLDLSTHLSLHHIFLIKGALILLRLELRRRRFDLHTMCLLCLCIVIIVVFGLVELSVELSQFAFSVLGSIDEGLVG